MRDARWLFIYVLGEFNSLWIFIRSGDRTFVISDRRSAAFGASSVKSGLHKDRLLNSSVGFGIALVIGNRLT